MGSRMLRILVFLSLFLTNCLYVHGQINQINEIPAPLEIRNHVQQYENARSIVRWTASPKSDKLSKRVVPVVSSITPSSGSYYGGTVITIAGSGFTGATSVTFAGIAGTSLIVSSDGLLTVTTPNFGYTVLVAVRVVGPGGSSVTSGPTYQYVAPPPPAIASLNPPTGSTSSGTQVQISGTYFTGTTSVMFGTVPATSFTVGDDNTILAVAPSLAAGPFGVTVTTPGGTSGSMTYTAITPLPFIASLNPPTGSTSSGTQVQISGTGFTGTTSVMFGTVPATTFTVSGDNSITAILPFLAAGSYPVTVTTPGGTSAPVAYTAVVPVPIIGTLSPPSGSTSGGTQVQISGTGFTGTTAVMFGTVPATTFTVSGDNSITAIAPSLAAGSYSVTVTTSGGTSVPVTYNAIAPVPVIASLSPSSGSTAGGNQVQISGTGFTGMTTVMFGTVPATSFTTVSDNSVTAIVPSLAAGSYSVQVTTPGGTSIGSTYVVGNTPPPPPSVIDISPSMGISGSSVTLTGFHLSGTISVSFGGTASVFQVNNDNSILVTVPALAPGSYAITVTSSAGSSNGVTFTLLSSSTTLSSGSALSTGLTSFTSSGLSLASSGSSSVPVISTTLPTTASSAIASSDAASSNAASLGATSSMSTPLGSITSLVSVTGPISGPSSTASAIATSTPAGSFKVAVVLETTNNPILRERQVDTTGMYLSLGSTGLIALQTGSAGATNFVIDGSGQLIHENFIAFAASADVTGQGYGPFRFTSTLVDGAITTAFTLGQSNNLMWSNTLFPRKPAIFCLKSNTVETIYADNIVEAQTCQLISLVPIFNAAPSTSATSSSASPRTSATLQATVTPSSAAVAAAEAAAALAIAEALALAQAIAQFAAQAAANAVAIAGVVPAGGISNSFGNNLAPAGCVVTNDLIEIVLASCGCKNGQTSSSTSIVNNGQSIAASTLGANNGQNAAVSIPGLGSNATITLTTIPNGGASQTQTNPTKTVVISAAGGIKNLSTASFMINVLVFPISIFVFML